MSINVTVNGKPINLNKKREVMVTCEEDTEFHLRRKIRLQQVRQQSKEIAAEVRNRIKQEKTKQISNVENRTVKDFKKFQEKKLQKLHKHYEDCNREIGAAHKNAAMEKDPVEVLNEISKKNVKSAQARLKTAVENKINYEHQRKNKFEILEKQRKYAKEIEKTRANLVVAINKQHNPSKVPKTNKKRKKKIETTNLNDTHTSDVENTNNPPPRCQSSSPVNSTKTKMTPPHEQPEKNNTDDEENQSELCDEKDEPQEREDQPESDINSIESDKHLTNDIFPCEKKSTVNIEQTEKESKCSLCCENCKSRDSLKEKSKTFISKSKPLFCSDNYDLICNEDKYLDFLPNDKTTLQPVPPPIPTKCASNFSSLSSVTKNLSKDEIRKIIEEHQPPESCRSMDFYKNTKISDRIRQRSDQLNQVIDLESMSVTSDNKCKISNFCETRKLQMKNIPIVDIPSMKKKSKEVSKLPYVPKTTLKSKIVTTTVPQQQTSKVKYYDHSKHISKTYIPPPSVQKLDKDSVIVDPSDESEENTKFVETMCNHEQKAKIRGEKALKKTQIQNSYKQLMEELPVLQRQERLAAMRNHNPEFHMTDERISELERRRQNRIENIFEKYYHKSKTLETPIITIRPVQKSIPDDDMKLPFTALDVSEDLQSFNVGHWKSEYPSQTSRRPCESQYSNRRVGSSMENKFQFIDSKETSTETSSHKQLTDEDSKQKCLAELLHRLNKQRELLLQEVQNLPPTSNLQKIFHGDPFLHVTEESSNSMMKPKFVSASTSPKSSEPKKTKNVKKRQGVTTSSDSPEEKHKKRQKPKEKKPKVHKNDEGTQTSPDVFMKTSPSKEKPETKSVAVQETKNKEKNHGDDGGGDINDNDKLCEIIIKMCDDSKVKICTQPIGSVDTKYEEKIQKQFNCDISSSTSYLSPPVVCPKPIELRGLGPSEKLKSDYKESLYGKPKQTNIDSFTKREHGKEERIDHVKKHSISKQKHVKSHTPTKIINPQLLNYIKKLLSMSRKSIDDLTVSSVSEVSSPSPHIIESQHNNPFIQLQNVMNYYNLSFADIQNQLSKSISANTTKSDKTVSNTNAEIEQLEEDSSPTSDDVDYSEILSKYQEVTRTCVEKISTLTLMIDKIRAEKENILSPLSVDFNENSLTSYLELPPQKSQKCDSPLLGSSKNGTSASSESNKSYSLTQDEIDKYFLEIGSAKKDSDQLYNAQGDNKDSFIPMLKGIPKYNNDPIINQINVHSKPRPPASLAQNVQRYNLNIDMTPHELSTIAELDTVTTSKNISEQRPKSPEDHIPMRDSGDTQTNHSKEEISTSNSGFITISPEQDISPKKEHRKSPRNKSAKTLSHKKTADLELSGMQLLSSHSENTSSSSPENFENILRTMGLGWAISTLKKTQEALALSSSSSSDSSLRKHVSSNNSTSISDITLKEVLNREFLKKLSSSSSLESPNLQELQDISDIVGGAQNKDRSTQRTSTPVHQSKSTDSKNNLFASVSDISSVRQHSDENIFLSIPDVSLDTNRSLK